MSGYTTAATLIANAMHQAYQEGVNLDEMFGVLSVQKEVTAVHLAQAALHQQAQLAQQAQEQAELEADLANDEVPEVDQNAN
jgi:outer membrane protease